MPGSAERQRLLHQQAQARYRARQRDDLSVLRVTADPIAVAMMLADLGLLPDGDGSTREQIEAALSQWLYQTVTHHQRERWPGA